MGKSNKTVSEQAGSSLADALFSGTQKKVLALLFGKPDRSFYASEIIELAASGSGAVQRELGKLVSSGLLTSTQIGSQRHYQANRAAPIFEELFSIVQKTVGLVEPLRIALFPVSEQIKGAFVYGSVAKNQDTAQSDIDLMIVSDTLTFGDTFIAVDTVSRQLGREVNPTIFTMDEFNERREENSSFISRVLEQPKVWVVGGAHDLGL